MTSAFNLTNPAKPTAEKDPDATLDYTWDWTAWLLSASNDTISAFVVTPPAGVTVVSSFQAAGKITAFLSGGVAGQTYTVGCKITTTGGRIDERSIYLKIKNK